MENCCLEIKEPPCTCIHCNTPENLLRPARGGKSWAAILFIIHIIGFMFLSGFVHGKLDSSTKPIKDMAGKEGDPSMMLMNSIREDRVKSNIPFVDLIPHNIAAAKVFVYGFCWSILFSFILTDLLMMAMYFVPAYIVNVSMITEIVQFAVMAIAAIYFGYTWTGRFFCLITFIAGAKYRDDRGKIPFAAAVLKTTMIVLKKHPALIVVNGSCFWVSLLYFTQVIRTLDILFTLYKQEQPYVIYCAIYSGFTLFWSLRFTFKMVRFIIANVYTTDLYSSISNQKVPNPTIKSLKRALTYSFGRICYESLIPGFGRFTSRERDSKLQYRRAKASALIVFPLITVPVGSLVYLLVTQYFNLPKELSVKYAIILGFLSNMVPYTAMDTIETASKVVLQRFAKDPLAFAHSKDSHYNSIAHTYLQVCA